MSKLVKLSNFVSSVAIFVLVPYTLVNVSSVKYNTQTTHPALVVICLQTEENRGAPGKCEKSDLYGSTGLK